MKQSELALSLRQLSAMLTAGVPIVESLTFLARSLGPELREVYSDLAARVSQGSYLSNAMSRQPEVFAAPMVALVRLGEESGSLILVLSQLAAHMERGVGFRQRMLAALTYPAVLLFVSLGLVWLLSYSLLPSMLPFFQQLGVPLPALTQVVLWLTKAAASPGALLGLGLLVVSALLLRRQLAEAEEDSDLRHAYDRLLLNLPVLGPLVQQTICARLLRMLGLTGLLGLDLSRALKLLEGVAGNSLIRHKLALVREDVHEGAPLSEAFARHRLFHRGVHAMLRIGEEAGKLPRMTELLADLYDQDVAFSLTRITALAEPLILMGTSLFVGTLCIATLLPWINLMKGIT